MDLRLVDYLIYIVASAMVTIWVGRTLYHRGRAFLVSVFKEEGLADSVNHLLVVGFYLINFGAVALLINSGGAPSTVADMVQETATRLGVAPPVRRAERWRPHVQDAFDPVRHLAAGGVEEPRLGARHRRPRRAGTDPTGTVREDHEDRFRGAQPVENLER